MSNNLDYNKLIAFSLKRGESYLFKEGFKTGKVEVVSQPREGKLEPCESDRIICVRLYEDNIVDLFVCRELIPAWERR